MKIPENLTESISAVTQSLIHDTTKGIESAMKRIPNDSNTYPGNKQLRAFSLVAAVLLILALVTACGGSASSPTTASTQLTTVATNPPASSPTEATIVVTPTPAVVATSTLQLTPASTALPSGSPTANTNPGGTPSSGSGAGYLDDRSTAEEVIRSYYNAINSKEYVRAYSYWQPDTPSTLLAPFDQFRQGYANTLNVNVTFGAVGSGVAAGNLYFSVPVELQAQTSDHVTQTFVGCYVVHLGQPANQTVPPFQPMAIQSAKIDQVASIASTGDLLTNACKDQPGGVSGTVTPPANPDSIDAGNYLDNRSDGTEVIRSFYNAINRHEYARAYSYWQPNTPSSLLAPFDQFQQGYANTKSVALTTGTVTTDAGAGQRYWSVPVTIVSTLNDGSNQTFVGCYDLHLPSPIIQAQPPFQELGIQQANVKQVKNGSDTASIMMQACQP